MPSPVALIWFISHIFLNQMYVVDFVLMCWQHCVLWAFFQGRLVFKLSEKNKNTRWFEYDRDICGLFTHKSVPVIFEPPCISPQFWDAASFFWGGGEIYCRHFVKLYRSHLHRSDNRSRWGPCRGLSICCSETSVATPTNDVQRSRRPKVSSLLSCLKSCSIYSVRIDSVSGTEIRIQDRSNME